MGDRITGVRNSPPRRLCSQSKGVLAQPDGRIGLSHEQYQLGIQKIMSSDDSRAATQLYTDAVATAARVRELHQRLRSIMTQVAGLRGLRRLSPLEIARPRAHMENEALPAPFPQRRVGQRKTSGDGYPRTCVVALRDAEHGLTCSAGPSHLESGTERPRGDALALISGTDCVCQFHHTGLIRWEDEHLPHRWPVWRQQHSELQDAGLEPGIQRLGDVPLRRLHSER